MQQRINSTPSITERATRLFIRHDYLKILMLFILFRLLITIIGVFAANITMPTSAFIGQVIYETHRITAPDTGRLSELFILPWFRWDTGWYLKIAALGYSATDGTIIFPPLYPFLVRVITLSFFNGNYLLGGLVLSNVFSAICFVLFYKLAKRELGSEALAWRSMIYMVASPAAFYFAAAYSESTFLIFALAAWIAVSEQKWVRGGILAGIASLARLQGWLLAIPFLWYLISNNDSNISGNVLHKVEQVMRRYTSRSGWEELFSRILNGGWAVIVLPPLAFVSYSLWLSFQRLGSIGEAYQRYWALTVVPPWEGIFEFMQRVISGNLLLTDWVDLSVFLIVLWASIFAIGKLKIGYSLYLWATLVLVFMRGYSAQLLPGFMRYSLTLFPIFWIIPQIVKNKYLEMLLLTLSLLVQYMLLWMFLNWYWVA